MLAVAITVTAATGSSGAAAPDPGPDLSTAPCVVGHDGLVGCSGPSMQPVRLPVPVSSIAAQPGPAGLHDQVFWGVGLIGYDSPTRFNQHVVFERHDAAGWHTTGPPRNVDGSQLDIRVGAGVPSLTAAGDGWEMVVGAGTQQPYLLHHRAGTMTWQVDAQGTDAIRAVSGWSVASVSMASDALGTYGYALLGSTPGDQSPRSVVISYDSTRAAPWQVETTLQGALSAVAVAGRGEAWAVGSAYSLELAYCTVSVSTSPVSSQCTNALQQFAENAGGASQSSAVYHRDPASNSWQAVMLPPTLAGGSATAVTALAADRNGAWVGGMTARSATSQDHIDSSSAVVTAQTPAPFLLHYTPQSGSGFQATSFCDASAGSCDGQLPVAAGAVACLQVVPRDAGGDDLFAATLSGSDVAGLFHLVHDAGSPAPGTWDRLPTVVGPITGLAFVSADEGWVSAAVYGHGPTPVAGHWSRDHLDPVDVRRWPTMSLGDIGAVAEDPGGSGVVMAAGNGAVAPSPASGRIVRLEPSTGRWIPMGVPAGTGAIRSLSWPRPQEAWATDGTHILHWRGGDRWSDDAVSGMPQGASIAALAVAAQGLAAPPTPPSSSGPTPSPSPTSVPVASAPLAAWGGNGSGELGIGSTPDHVTRPTAVTGVSGVIDLDAGGGAFNAGPFSLAIACPCDGHGAGTVYGWGDNTRGQLARDPAQVPRLLKPTALPMPAGVWFTAVSAGGGHSLALANDGSVYAWGDNSTGQLGDGSATVIQNSRFTSTPAKVANLSGATAIAAGANSSYAVEGGNGGSVVAWGSNHGGQLGVTTETLGFSTVPVLVPGVARVVAIAAGAEFALATDGTLVDAWGNYAGCQGSAAASAGGGCAPQPLAGMPTTGIRTVAADRAGGGSYVVTTAGQLYPCCNNGVGSATPLRGLGSSPVTQVRVDAQHTVAVEADGTIYGWGADSRGETGDGTTLVQTVTPVRVPGIVGAPTPADPNLSLIAAGLDHTLAVPSPAGDAPAAVAQAAPAGSSTPQAAAASSPGTVGMLMGYAVGSTPQPHPNPPVALVLRYDGTSWTALPSPSSSPLDAVTAAGGMFVLGGTQSAVLVDDGGGVRPAAVASAVHQAAVISAAGLADGTVLLGRDDGSLLEHDPGDPAGSLHVSAIPPLSDPVAALSIRRDAAGLHALAEVCDACPYGAADECTGCGYERDGWLVEYRPQLADWVDAEHAEVFTGNTDVSSAKDDHYAGRPAVLAAVLDPSTRTGWAVGQNGTVWRFSADGRPAASPMARTAALEIPRGGTSFAYMANTGCMQGWCGNQLGWGSRGDVISGTALDEIAAAAGGGALTFVAVGGDVARIADADAMGLVHRRFASMPIPVYAAPGAKDLGPTASSSNPLTGGTVSVRTTSCVWQQSFAAAPAPWGVGPVPAGITAVSGNQPSRPTPSPTPGVLPAVPTLPGGSSGSCTGSGSRAATHYAFDVAGPQGPLRIVVVDTSGGTSTLHDPSNQNPSEDEGTWLTTTLQDAHSRAIPAVVVMNTPAVDTAPGGGGDATVDADVASLGVAGVLASAVPANQMQASLLGGVPVGVFAAGGGWTAAPGAEERTAPEAGGYFAWQLVTIAPDAGGVPRMSVRSIPVLGSAAIDAPTGTSTPRGGALQFTALGRGPDVGAYDDDFGATGVWPNTVSFPFPQPCGQDHPGGIAGTPCRAATVAPPDYSFSSDDDGSVLVQVRAIPGPNGQAVPLLDSAHHPVLDDTHTSGLFCAVAAGSTLVRFTSGTVQAALPVSIGDGALGSCGTLPPATRPKPVAPPVPAAPQQPLAPAAHQLPLAQSPVYARPPSRVQPGPQPAPQRFAIAPPVSNPAPAPPGGSSPVTQGVSEGAAAPDKDEEHQAATQDLRMTALRSGAFDEGGGGALLGWGAAGLGGAVAAALAGRAHRRRRARPVPAWLGNPLRDHRPPRGR